MVTLGGVLSIQQILHNKQIITVPFRDEPILIMTSEEVADVARHGSDIENPVPPKKPSLQTWVFYSLQIKGNSLQKIITYTASLGR